MKIGDKWYDHTRARWMMLTVDGPVPIGNAGGAPVRPAIPGTVTFANSIPPAVKVSV